MYPNAPLIPRGGEVNAWDNADFRAAVRSQNKSQIIIGGILTDVCTAFLAQSLRDEGYSVWANAEASGTSTPMVRDLANDIMRTAGVHVTSLFGIVGELMRDWRGPYSGDLLTYFDDYFPTLGMLARFHLTAIENGTIVPGEAALPV
ncbi:hypothetical protein BP6252_08951 [Coleophoma cylindrospora]|uniref:Isochorismatase-like domain-containing protein n=1 Tax=Coleophoma cylindrospora TaxID=1849047 RepID=A0A3D8R0L4_9HELO|nr:hypothetical protein BP6252_08951 [Coleophoma cylindrospora]